MKPGIYEQVINNKIDSELKDIPADRFSVEKIDEKEAPKILAQYVSEIIENGLNNIADISDSNDADNKISRQIELINNIIGIIRDKTNDNDYIEDNVNKRAETLLALLNKNDMRFYNKRASDIPRPLTSLKVSSLFTGARHEPQLYEELKKEIGIADRIDMLVSFIRWSGLRLIINELEEFTNNGGRLRIITTSYMGATEVKAIEELNKLQNTEIKISYDTQITRLHAKAYIFSRDSGYSTAYIGSSNLSNAAMSSGLEWNIKATQKDLPETIAKVKATFETYWDLPDFEKYESSSKPRLMKALKAEKYLGDSTTRSFVSDVNPYYYQQEILDALEAERTIRGYNKNLVVAATGTGKTLIAAFDYRRYRQKNPKSPCRLLFIVHREEILKQSIEAFREVLKDNNFGDLFVGGYKPEKMDYLFASVQTANSQKFYETIPADYYDFIVVDEFHHAEATTYKRLLTHFTPKILLGLTATPERMDGGDILEYFSGRIAAEIRLPEAVERKLLCPFQYFGVRDTVDLNELRWTKGGYDKSELEGVYVMDRIVAEKRADYIVRSIDRYVADGDKVKGLGFCVSIKHANFMSEYFNAHNIPSMALSAKSTDEERNNAKARLLSGEIKYIFVVDLYNEGVDIPAINTVLFLRPTESLTIFLQQLGRGLRHCEGKDCLTVLDFVGQANKSYNFEERFSALLTNTKRGVANEIKNGFTSLPKGCYIMLEKKAKEIILENISQSFSTQRGMINRIKDFRENSGKELNLSNFLRYYHLSPLDIYAKNSFYRLCVLADVKENFQEPLEEKMQKAFGRFASVDSRRFINYIRDILPKLNTLNFSAMSALEKRFFQMFYITIWLKAADFAEETEQNISDLAACPQLVAELNELLSYNYEMIDFIDEAVDLGFDSPLDLHCRYTRDQLLVAMDELKPNNMRQGVKWIKDKGLDVFLVTLNKSDKDYSPTTMYNDYSKSNHLFHWQSQSTTSEDRPTGKRYANPNSKSKVLLFVRENKEEMKITAPYTFLGTAKYVSHEGSKPMNVIWHLDKEIPAKFIIKTNQLMAN